MYNGANTLFVSLVIADAVTEALAHGRHGGKESVVSGSTAQNLPEVFDGIELWTVAGQRVELDVAELGQSLPNARTLVRSRCRAR